MANKKKGKTGATSQAVPAEATTETPKKPGEGEGEDTGQSCPVVGFGASAGGLEAMTEVLRALPDDPGMAVVFHPAPGPEALEHAVGAAGARYHHAGATGDERDEGRTEQGLRDRAEHVHRAAQGRALQRAARPCGAHMPIDYFFRSLAEDQGSKAIGVVLSGTAIRQGMVEA